MPLDLDRAAPARRCPPASTSLRGWNAVGRRAGRCRPRAWRLRGSGRVGNQRAQALAERRSLVRHGIASVLDRSPATFGVALRVGAVRVAGAGSAGVPRLARLAREHLAGERQVGLRAARLRVVQHHRQAVAGRFAEPDVPRDDGVERLFLEELPHVARHLLAQVRALVVHRQQDALDVERRVERRANAAHRRHEVGEPLEREVLAVQRDEHGVGGDERVERQEAERRRTVDEDVVERGRASGRSRRPKALFAARAGPPSRSPRR